MNAQVFQMTQESIIQAAQLLRQGELVAFPTETVYGLGASIFNQQAIRKIYEVKGRPSDNPLIAHIAQIADAELIGKNIPDKFYKLAQHFFPGPLTLVVEKQANVPDIATAELPTIGIRMPNHPVALALIKATKTPLVAPSANLSGKPSPTTAAHVYEDLKEKIPLILDGGPCNVGIESTVLDLTQAPYTILRPGHITKNQIEIVLGETIVDYTSEDNNFKPKAPGMKYAHYKPTANIHITYLENEIYKISTSLKHKRVLLMTNIDMPLQDKFVKVEPISEDSLYRIFREADKLKITDILIYLDEKTQLSHGLINRITKASGA